MKLFSCKIRLRGNPLDEVRKVDVTSAEITVLKALHGDDGVTEVIETHPVAFDYLDGPNGPDGEKVKRERTEATERERLMMRYGDHVILKIFGAPQAKIGDEINPEGLPQARRSRAPAGDMLAA
jgi:hypothetical protein